MYLRMISSTHVPTVSLIMKLATRLSYAHFFAVYLCTFFLFVPVIASSKGLPTQQNEASISSPDMSRASDFRDISAAQTATGTLQNPLFVRTVPDVESESDAAHKRYEQQEKPSLDRGIAYATYALAFSTVLLTGFTGLMWHATYQLALLSKANAEKQAADTRDSLAISKAASDAAREAADAAKQQMLIASDELHRSHRPWLTLADQAIPCTLKILDQEVVSTTLLCTVVNGGTSIAKAYNNFFSPIVVPEDADPRNYIAQGPIPDVTGFGGLLLPSANRAISTELSAPCSHITTSRFILLISLTLVYIDEFDKKHSTRHVLRFKADSNEYGVSKAAKTVRGSFQLFGIGAHAD
jgi:hypothetical protein